MYLAEYLLSIREFLTEDISSKRPADECPEKKSGEALIMRAFSEVDEERKKKAQRLRPGRVQAASLGAGLLLQLAVGETLDRHGTERNTADTKEQYRFYSVSQLLAELERFPRVSPVYRYGKNGKPYFRDLPFYFNLSHSGDYVLCGLSTEDIGVDIQRHRAIDGRRLARRFFSRQELDALEASGEKEELFFRLWARKEAYGKLTGEGVAGALKVNLLAEEGMLPDGRKTVWKEWGDIAGYSAAVVTAQPLMDIL